MTNFIRFYVVVANGRSAKWRSRLFEDCIAGALTYPTRKKARDAASKARLLYGWAKVIKCEIGDPL